MPLQQASFWAPSLCRRQGEGWGGGFGPSRGSPAEHGSALQLDGSGKARRARLLAPSLCRRQGEGGGGVLRALPGKPRRAWLGATGGWFRQSAPSTAAGALLLPKARGGLGRGASGLAGETPPSVARRYRWMVPAKHAEHGCWPPPFAEGKGRAGEGGFGPCRGSPAEHGSALPVSGNPPPAARTARRSGHLLSSIAHGCHWPRCDRRPAPGYGRPCAPRRSGARSARRCGCPTTP